MEWDPETNTYTSHGPTARLRDAETTSKRNADVLKRLVQRIDDLESRVDDLECRIEY